MTWVLGALLGSLTSWTQRRSSFIFCALFFSGLSLYFLARHWMPEGPAIFAACLYAANPYALFNAYERSAYGELLAGAWLPLLLLFALRRSGRSHRCIGDGGDLADERSGRCDRGIFIGGCGDRSRAIVEREWWPVVRAAFGTALGMGMACLYIVPAAYERRWVEIDRADRP